MSTCALRETQPKVIACIPAYNEEKHIADIVARTRPYVDMVFVIDDGSEDATALLAERAGAIIFKHEKNRGKGAAVNTAFSIARELRLPGCFPGCC